MTDLEALTESIIAEPADDTRRLIYADALEEAGYEEKAAFVRLHVEAARLPAYDPLALRAVRLEQQMAAQYASEFPGLPAGMVWANQPYRRGVPASVVVSDGDAFLSGANDLFAIAPVECIAMLAIRPGEVAPLAGCLHLRRITELRFPMGLSAWIAREMFNSSHLTGLTELHVGPAMTVMATAGILVRSKVFTQLTGLSWRDDSRQTGAIIGTLSALRGKSGMKRLDISGNRITLDILHELAESSVLKASLDLDLSDNPLSPENLHIFNALAGLENLRMLRLKRTRHEPSLGAIVPRSRVLNSLHGLELGENSLDPTALNSLAKSNSLNELRYLGLQQNRLGDRGIQMICENPSLIGLLTLDLTANRIGDAGGLTLATASYLGGLVHLDLSDNPLSPGVVDQLRERFGSALVV